MNLTIFREKLGVNMQYADLHVHSTFSDGLLSPEEILKISYKRGIKYISITDHDTIESQYAVEEFFSIGEPIVIPGVELSIDYEGYEVHILGYFINIYNNGLVEELDRVKLARVSRAENIIDKLNKINVNISQRDIEIDKFASIGRPHIAKILVDKGYANNVKEAFYQYLSKGKPGYADRYKIHYKKALELITTANGIPVLAHPGEIYKGLSVEKLLKDLKVYGLKGIEVFHPSHSDSDTNKFYNLSKKLNLQITGGSDCHGSYVDNKIQMGITGLNEVLTQKLLAQNKHD
jgi:3',5'-nucleoside bisphosphate phosphatase